MEALTLRASLALFASTFGKGESAQLMILRLDTIVEEANSQAELVISDPLRAWMLLALLRHPPRNGLST